MTRFFSFALPLLLGSALHAQEAVTARTIIVMDGSGSMWGQIDGVPKLEIARRTVGEVLADLPREREIGLVAYGHRTRGDCADIEVMVPPAAGTSGAILGAVEAMRFQGRTPLSAAVRRAAETLRYTEDPATVVLVTDGLETCEADPCALGRELEEAGLDFTAHVVGFGLTEEEGAQVSCLAENTGGRYFEASDGAALTDALDQTLTAAAPPIVEVAPLPDATLEAADSAPILAYIDVAWTGPGAEDDYLEIVEDVETPGRWLTFAYVDPDSDTVSLQMPPGPGDYLIRYVSTERQHAVLAERPITVTEAEFVLDGPAGAAPAETIEVFWRGPGGAEDYIDIQRADTEATSGETSWAWARDGNPAAIRVPVEPGDYNLRYVVQGVNSRAVGLAIPFTVTEPKGEIVAPAAVRPGAEFPARAEGPVDSDFWVDIVPPGFAAFSGEIDYFYLYDGGVPGVVESSLTAPEEPGSYELRYVVEDMRGNRTVIRRQPVEVRADAPETEELPGLASETEATAEPTAPPPPPPRAPTSTTAPTDAGAPADAPAPAETAPAQDADLGEDVGQVCDGPAPCDVTLATGLAVTLPGGWFTDMAHTVAEGTRVRFMGPKGTPTLTLNVPEAQGTCTTTAAGRLCGPDRNAEAFGLIAASLGAAQKVGADRPTTPDAAMSNMLDEILGAASGGNSEGADMIRQVLDGMSMEDIMEMGRTGTMPDADTPGAEAGQAIPIPLGGRDRDALLDQILGR
ncbi:vWA domain-containing protein [Roseobacter sp. HKCCA0434]|uniref:vWA domain-containing protein n=1 Tax=Roseobacter sp. HKCCA0434 TaxID=3079297 RepID=UPI002905ED2D|nr:VWA domain-containing protein [Roseobacter sp. HKCCA0434]